ncbi:MAG: glycosyltransferase family 4 protein [Flavobacteriaceae bacterium]|nr:glycosyltransferase family 4 protein [Flavobacteriaceae bacterium]
MTDGKNNKPILIMMYVSLSSFVKRDIFLLSNDFQVINYHFNTNKKWKLPFAFIKQLFFLFLNFKKIDVIVTQSSGYLSFLPSVWNKITKTPLVIIAIGTDCVKMPEIKYGAHSKNILGWFTRYSFKNASLILPVHKSLIFNKYTYTSLKYSLQGIKAFVPSIQTPIIEVVNGFDTDKWVITNHNRPKHSFLTVTTAINETGYFLKGVDLIVEMAENFPKFQFTIVGKVKLLKDCPTNLKILPNVAHDELLEIYNSHEYYLQLSLSEGFPNALCEAMLCGCIPIGSNVAGIPDIIGGSGYILHKKDANDLKLILINLQSNYKDKTIVRERIVLKYGLLKRQQPLIKYITEILG